jgi:hypothetical protein
MVERPHSIRGGPGLIPGRCSSIFGIWREVLGRNVYITSQYFFPAIIYRDIISHITSTYRYIMYFFRTFKKSTAPYKVHNMGLRYIKYITDNYGNKVLIDLVLTKTRCEIARSSKLLALRSPSLETGRVEGATSEHLNPPAYREVVQLVRYLKNTHFSN